MKSCLDDDVIAAMVAGDPSARGALAHLETCDACRELVSLARARQTGAATDAVPRIAAGVLVGRHRIVRPLGAGGMGVVYLARDTDLDRDVAVKLLRARNADAQARLVRESQALARLNHPNVVTAYEVARHDHAMYLVMEHVDAGTVREWIASAPRTTEDIVGVFAQAARGLAAAHAAELVHRDIKPDNILVGSDGRARLADFGLAAETDDGHAAGTRGYMAPEVVRGAPADSRSDQWSLCAALYESLFATPVGDVPASAPAWLRGVLVRGLAEDPSARFASAGELADALAPPKRLRRWPIAAAIGLAAIATTAGVAVGARESRPACAGELPGVWDAARRLAIGAQLGKDAPAVLAALDDYAARWGQQQVEVCRAARADDVAPVTELRAACLANRRRALGVLVDALAAVDAQGAQFARRAVYALPALDDCNAAEHLAARQPEPRDPQQRAELAKLSIWFDSARTKASLGDPRGAIPLLLDIAERAERLGYHPLVADALRVAGREQLPLKEAESIVTLRRALHAAHAGADDVLIAEISIDLVASAAMSKRPEAERDELIAGARAAVARLRWRQDSTLVGMESFLAWAVGQDALARGALDVAEREMRAAVAAGVIAFGAHDRRLPPLRNGLAQVLKRRGKQDEAAVVWAQSLDTDELTSSSSSVMRVPELGGVPLSLVEAAWELHDVGRDAEAQAFVERVRRATAGTTLPIHLSATLDDLESSIALARGDLAKARMLNARALAALGTTNVTAHTAGFQCVRGEILEASGDCAAAKAVFREVLAAPSHRTLEQAARLGVARCHARAGELAEAAAIFDRELADGIEIARTLPTALLAAADVHYRLGARDKAHELAREGLRAIANLPALIREQAALAAWILAHPT